MTVTPAYAIPLSQTELSLIGEICAIQGQIEFLMQTITRTLLGVDHVTVLAILGSTTIGTNADIFIKIVRLKVLIPLALSSDAIHDPWIGRERCQASGLGDEALPGGSDRGLDGVVVCEKAVGEEALLQEQPQPLDRIELG